jgi:hypothetical protein
VRRWIRGRARGHFVPRPLRWARADGGTGIRAFDGLAVAALPDGSFVVTATWHTDVLEIAGEIVAAPLGSREFASIRYDAAGLLGPR